MLSGLSEQYCLWEQWDRNSSLANMIQLPVAVITQSIGHFDETSCMVCTCNGESKKLGMIAVVVYKWL